MRRARRRPARRPRYPAAASGTNLAPLRVPAFGRLLFSYTTNSIGDYVGLVALALLVYGETQDPLATTALFIAAQFLPAFVSPILTAHVDQRSLRTVLPADLRRRGGPVRRAGAARELVLAAARARARADRRRADAHRARAVARRRRTPCSSRRDLLREGNGLLNMGFAAASVGGAALGGLLVDLFGIEAALLVDAASFAVIAVVLATCTAACRSDGVASPSRSSSAPARACATRARTASRGFLIGGEALAVIFFTLIVPIEIVYAAETLQTDDLGYGILLSSWGAGIVLGSLVFLGVRRRSVSVLVLGSTLAIGVRLPRHGRRARAVGGVRVLGPRRPRQRRPVGVGHDGAPGVDARRPPGPDHRAARVGRRRPRPASAS